MKAKIVLVFLFLMAPLIGWAEDVVIETDIKLPDNVIRPSQLFKKGVKGTDGKWNGVDPSTYASMDFYDKNGIAHIKGQFNDYTPEMGKSTFTMEVRNWITGKSKVTAVELATDGTFSADIPIQYPQKVKMHYDRRYQYIFLMPGDTVNIITTTKNGIGKDGFISLAYLGFGAPATKSAIVNVIADSLSTHYNLDNLIGRYSLVPDNAMTENLMSKNAELSAILDHVLSDIPNVIGALPLNSELKDYISMQLVSNIIQSMEYNEMMWNFEKGKRFTHDENGNYYYTEGETIDLKNLIAPRLTNIELLYNNPLVLCGAVDVPHLIAFNHLFYGIGFIIDDEENLNPDLDFINRNHSLVERLKSFDTTNKDLNGIGNCFMSQFCRTTEMINTLSNYIKYPSENPLVIDYMTEKVASIVGMNDYVPLNSELLTVYSNFLSSNNEGMGKRKSIIRLSDTEKKVFDDIIKPYRGNVLFLDFWAMWCASCRDGMIGQKEYLEAYSEKPFRALYISNANDRRTECEEWLSQNEIKGEHIFVSEDVWNKLYAMFDIFTIPFAIIVDKDGSIVTTARDFSSNIIENLF